MAWLAAAFPTIASWINLIIGWVQAKVKAQADQNTAVSTAEQDHEQDGAQSVADQNSSDAQNAALDQKLKQIDNPTPVVVIKPIPPTGGQ
jgi:hypothetical protein